MSTEPRRRGRPPKNRAPEEAVREAMEHGQKIEQVEQDGETFYQRPMRIDLTAPEEPQPRAEGERVKVYHKNKTTLHLTDCTLGPYEEGYILKSDAEMPHISQKVLRVLE